MKVLVVKADLSEEASLPKWLWLDRLCNGLLSWGAARGLFAAHAKWPWILAQPRDNEFNRIYLWTAKGAVPWAALPEEAAAWQLLGAGELSAADMESGRRRFPQLESWQVPTVSPLVPGEF